MKIFRPGVLAKSLALIGIGGLAWMFIFTPLGIKIIKAAGNYISLYAVFPTAGTIQRDGGGSLQTYDIEPGGTYGPVDGTVQWEEGFPSPLPAMGMGAPGAGYLPDNYPLGCTAYSSYPGAGAGNSGVPTGFGGDRICEITFNTPYAGIGRAQYMFYASPSAPRGALYLIGLTSNGGSNILEENFYLRIAPASCDITSLTATDLTPDNNTSVTLNFTASGSAPDWVISLDGNDVASGSGTADSWTTPNLIYPNTYTYTVACSADRTKNKVITIVPEPPPTHTLTVSPSGTGSGKVSFNPPEPTPLSLPHSETYEFGTSVTLTASPASGSTFAGWSGDCSGTGTCTVTMNSDKSVTAVFNTAVCSYSISPTSASFGTSGGTGSFSVIAGSGCAWSVGSGASWITITGGASGNGNGTVSYNVASNSGTSRSGTITVGGQTFTINQSGSGSGPTATINSPPSCTAPCNVKVSWTSSNVPDPPKVIKVYKNGTFLWNQVANVPGSETDWNQPVGTYKYCVRAVKADWSETGDLACSTTVVTAQSVTPKYKCSGASCIRDDVNGIYTASDCNNACAPASTPKYKCSGIYCIRDDRNGTYTTPDCSGACAPAIGFSCSPPTQTVSVNQPAQLSARGGTGSYNWSASGGSPSFDIGDFFTTTYSTPGIKEVWVSSGAATTGCIVDVRASGPRLSCSPPTQTVSVNQPAQLSASGGTGSYTWSAPYGLPSVGIDAYFATKYSTPGTKEVWVSSGVSNASCTVNVSAPPPAATHTVCQSGSCVTVQGAGSNQCSTNADCAPPPPPPPPPPAATHKECRNNACVVVSGAGSNQCSTNADCASSPPPAATHTVCQSGSCVTVQGAGSNQCSTNADCASPPPPAATHKECRNNACVVVSGAGSNQCSTNADCASSPSFPSPSCSSFTAAPDRIVIPPPRTVTLSWACSNADNGCTITPGVGSVPQSGSTQVTPSRTTDYVLQCSGRGGTSSQYHLPLGALRVYQFIGGKLREVVP